jgi:DNA-binding NarL/FixJ family response regulator
MLHVNPSLGRTHVARRSSLPNGSVPDDLLLRAAESPCLLQIGMKDRLKISCHGREFVRTVRSLEQALTLLAEEEFDAIILGAELSDAWPTTAYEDLAEKAGSTPVVVAADQLEPMLAVRRRQDRADDVVIPSGVPIFVLERIALAAVLRKRTLALLDKLGS